MQKKKKTKKKETIKENDNYIFSMNHNYKKIS